MNEKHPTVLEQKHPAGLLFVYGVDFLGVFGAVVTSFWAIFLLTAHRGVAGLIVGIVAAAMVLRIGPAPLFAASASVIVFAYGKTGLWLPVASYVLAILSFGIAIQKRIFPLGHAAAGTGLGKDLTQTTEETVETQGLLPLHEAAGNGEEDSVRQLIASGHDVDQRDEERGDSSLHAAIGEGNLSTTRLLLDLGANPNLSDFTGRTPLHTAALQGDSEIIQVLLDGGAEVDSQTDDWSTPLHLAVSERNEGAARRLLRGGASVDVPDKDLLTPLHGAVCRTDVESPSLVETLLKHGANPLWSDRLGRTPISRAEDSGYAESHRLLLLASSQYRLEHT